LTDLAANPQHPTAIASSTDVPAAKGNPEFCDVKGMIAPQTHFDLQLPVSTWQGRYLQNGCGGYCGSVGNQTFPSCDAQLGGDFAMATDDEGHVTAAGSVPTRSSGSSPIRTSTRCSRRRTRSTR
jgi:feruloyl esterase